MKFALNATVIALLCCRSAPWVCAGEAPPFTEVKDIIKKNLPGISDAELNHAAVKGLVDQLAPRVALDYGGEQADSPPTVTKTNLFEDGSLYARVGTVRSGLVGDVMAAIRGAEQGTKVKGIVMDMRYAGGTDYEAAARLVDAFLEREMPLLDWGSGPYRSAGKQASPRIPLVVLVNGQTTSAAEAVAGVVRESGAGLVLGNTTAGKAWRFQEFALSGGQKLRIARGQVLLGNGVALPETGVKPDIAVAVSPQDETAYFSDPYKVLASSEAGTRTNQARRLGPNEAGLVRERRGIGDADSARRNSTPETPQIKDPVLARALDLIKGLALVKQTKS